MARSKTNPKKKKSSAKKRSAGVRRAKSKEPTSAVDAAETRTKPVKRVGKKTAVAGRNPFQANQAMRELVRTLAALGLSQHDVALKIINPTTKNPINVKTLVQYFSEEFRTGKIDTTASIGAKVIEQANKGDFPSQKLWLETQAGWTRTNRFEHLGAGGGPIDIDIAARAVDKIRERLSRKASRASPQT